MRGLMADGGDDFFLFVRFYCMEVVWPPSSRIHLRPKVRLIGEKRCGGSMACGGGADNVSPALMHLWRCELQADSARVDRSIPTHLEVEHHGNGF